MISTNSCSIHNVIYVHAHTLKIINSQFCHLDSFLCCFYSVFWFFLCSSFILLSIASIHKVWDCISVNSWEVGIFMEDIANHPFNRTLKLLRKIHFSDAFEGFILYFLTSTMDASVWWIFGLTAMKLTEFCQFETMADVLIKKSDDLWNFRIDFYLISHLNIIFKKFINSTIYYSCSRYHYYS